MEKYDPRKIEPKWAKRWIEEKTFVPDLKKAKNPYYALFMFPYPSAEGLHIGNFYAFTSIDVMAKYKKLRSFDVFEPIGWDAFGIHSENYALKIGEAPSRMLKRTIQNFRAQIQAAGLSCDWTREVDTTAPEYYKWTQWIFGKLFEKGLAYQKEALVNWCPDCKTVLADEQIEGEGLCERCGTMVEKRKMKQWFFKITAYAERLLSGLKDMNWSDITKSAQKNWIGKSEGAEFELSIKNHELKIKVFTTRLDTVFGMTFALIAPEHELVQKLKKQITNWGEVEKYIEQTKKKTDLQRQTEMKDKTGVELKGVEVINPFTKKTIPLFASDFVLAHYGTGAVMAVPGHDQRDFEFAKKFNLPIEKVIEPCFYQLTEPGKIKEDESFEEREAIAALVKHWEKDEYIGLEWKEVAWKTLITGGAEKGQSPEEGARMEILQETGYKNLKLIKELPMVHSKFYHVPKKVNRFAHFRVFYFELENGEQENISKEEQARHKVVWVPKDKMNNFFTAESHNYIWQKLNSQEEAYTDDGVLNNSGKYNFLTSTEARKKLTVWLKKEGIGQGTLNYKLRDWCISRQRYWGPPIPVIYCRKCLENPKSQIPNPKKISNSKNKNFQATIIDGIEYAIIPVPEKDLPVRLPDLTKGWEPAGNGKGPLANVKSFIQTGCPKCGGEAQRETDVMDNFLDSAWYFFRYISTKDDKKIFDEKLGKKWLPIDIYIGGNEHAVLHLMYTRFITMFLHDLGLIDFDNPFKRFRANGMILKDGGKMSKSKGNVVNPEEYGEKIGYDALKTYLLFIGPLVEDRNFSDKGIMGAVHWAERVFNLQVRISAEHQDNEKLIRKLHKTIKSVAEDMENQKYNTAIAKLMEITNVFYEYEKISLKIWEKFLVIVAMFLPALSEELWSQSGHTESIFKQKWPEYNLALIQDEEIELVIQVNGKVRDRIEVPSGIAEKEATKLAKQSQKIQNFIGAKPIKKVIFVKNRLINIVI